jgi:hypothetical protein
MLYFAYGSNLDFNQMQKRCPSARFVTIAELADHQLVFTRGSQARGCGVASIRPKKDESVWGVVYDIIDADFGDLDKSEGYSPNRPPATNSYNRHKHSVLCDGRADKPLLVWLYEANPEQIPPLPSAEYKKLLVDGARFWHLPGGYISQLDQIEVAK